MVTRPHPHARPVPHFAIVGSPRSGTTLVQRLCCELEGVVVPYETHFFSAYLPVCRPRFPLAGMSSWPRSATTWPCDVRGPRDLGGGGQRSARRAGARTPRRCSSPSSPPSWPPGTGGHRREDPPTPPPLGGPARGEPQPAPDRGSARPTGCDRFAPARPVGERGHSVPCPHLEVRSVDPSAGERRVGRGSSCGCGTRTWSAGTKRPEPALPGSWASRSRGNGPAPRGAVHDWEVWKSRAVLAPDPRG